MKDLCMGSRSRVKSDNNCIYFRYSSGVLMASNIPGYSFFCTLSRAQIPIVMYIFLEPTCIIFQHLVRGQSKAKMPTEIKVICDHAHRWHVDLHQDRPKTGLNECPRGTFASIEANQQFSHLFPGRWDKTQ